MSTYKVGSQTFNSGCACCRERAAKARYAQKLARADRKETAKRDRRRQVLEKRQKTLRSFTLLGASLKSRVGRLVDNSAWVSLEQSVYRDRKFYTGCLIVEPHGTPSEIMAQLKEVQAKFGGQISTLVRVERNYGYPDEKTKTKVLRIRFAPRPKIAGSKDWPEFIYRTK